MTEKHSSVSPAINTQRTSQATTDVVKFPKTPARGQWYFMRRQLLRDKAALLGVLVLTVIVVMVIFAPIFTPFDPLIQSDDPADRLAEPSRTHPMGTDDLRRDLFSRILYGGRTTISVGVIAISSAAMGGLILGLLAGYYGGIVDNVISRTIDVLLSLPGILLAIVVTAILGAGLRNAMIAIAISSLPIFARLARGEMLVEKQRMYIESARAVGASNMHIIMRHILPNVVQSIIVIGTLRIAAAIQIAAGLSFLGLGAQPPDPEWGAMLSNGRLYMRTGDWWMTVFPGLAIFFTVMAINLIGDGLRDALDPRLIAGDKEKN